MQDGSYFGPESVTWKIASEAILNIGGARAVLMQLAHPLVATGVSAHSRYMSDPFGRAENTFLLGHMLTFGSRQTAQQAARTINRLHKHVYGTLPVQAGDFAAGQGYQAWNPELLLWVHATLIDTILLMYPLFVGPLNHDEQEQYYQESKGAARLLGLTPANMPATVDDLRRYVVDMIQSNQLAATPQARQLARRVLFPSTSELLRPLMLLNLSITCALLPAPIRELYDLEWGSRRQQAFQLSAIGIRMLMPHLPTALHILPLTRKMMREGKVA